MTLTNSETKIAVIGLGYVGLPLAAAFSEKFSTTGFDIDAQRVQELNNNYDQTGELSSEALANSRLQLCSDESSLQDCNIYIITVPTPIDKNKIPLLHPLINASQTVGRYLQQGDIVIYESTVYPGATEEVCIPELEKVSGKTFNQDFFVGYSPERINPGDKNRSLKTITKITSGSNPETAEKVDWLYRQIIEAGTFKASSLKVAEAAKVIENTQRDTNIALMNELALIFRKLDIDTEEVINAASTKWNFLPFKPGLVGGHCIGVDPYYLAHKAQRAGYNPELITASRKINDSMGEVVSIELMQLMTQKRIHIVDANILVMGVTFKENCPDLRNTRVADIVQHLETCNANVDIYDPVANKEETSALGLRLVDQPKENSYDAILLAVSHQEFIELGIEKIRSWGKDNSVVFDLKYIFPADQTDDRL